MSKLMEMYILIMCLFFLVYELQISEVGGRNKKHKIEETRRGICGESGNMTKEDLVVREIFLGLVNVLQVGS